MIREWITLLHVARHRLRSSEDYRQFQIYQGRLILNFLIKQGIRRARQLIAEAGLKIKRESTRFLPLNVARLPCLGEFLTWHVQFILSKEVEFNVKTKVPG